MRNKWKEESEYKLRKLNEDGDWEIILPADALNTGDLYKLLIHWHGGKGERIPAYAKRVIQDDTTRIFSASAWAPSAPYKWKNNKVLPSSVKPIIYEAHVGMATEHEKTGTFREFSANLLPVIADSGYNTIQPMAIQEHPYYGSFGYHVANFFAVSSRFGTPDDLREHYR